jgi:hypothetical protein
MRRIASEGDSGLKPRANRTYRDLNNRRWQQ